MCAHCTWTSDGCKKKYTLCNGGAAANFGVKERHYFAHLAVLWISSKQKPRDTSEVVCRICANVKVDRQLIFTTICGYTVLSNMQHFHHVQRAEDQAAIVKQQYLGLSLKVQSTVVTVKDGSSADTLG